MSITAGQTILASDVIAIYAKVFTAGEALTAGNKVMVAVGTEIVSSLAAGSESGAAGQEGLKAAGNALSQTFTTPSYVNLITTISPTNLVKVGSPTGTIYFEIYAVDGSHKPTGAALASVNQALASAAPSTITFNLTVSPSTEYAFVIRMSGATVGSSDYYYPQYADTAVTTIGYYGRSTDSGSTWTSPILTTNIICKINMTGLTAGRVYKSSADSGRYSTQFYNADIGFVEASASQAASVTIRVTGINANQTSLTIGSVYYLSDTPGAVASSAGTVSRKIGKAVSATEILLIGDNP